MDATSTLHDFLQATGLAGSDEYASTDNLPQLSARERHLLEWGRAKIAADAVILQRMPINNSCFPLAYLRQMDSLDPAEIAEAHKLAWNMGRAPLLLLVLPGQIRAYSTYERPRPKQRDGALDDEAGLIDTIDLIASAEQARQVLAKYKREELLSGRFWEKNRDRFKPGTRVEKNLLDNLSEIRSRLIEDEGLNARSVHSLLGRAIFIQYLQDRKDPQGYTAFPKDFFDQFVSGATTFPDVLARKRGTYELFGYLEDKFNGDIFPVTGTERDAVRPNHLRLLADFLRGKITLRNRQWSFWPHYSFDAIPIEFISSMYEEFFHYETEEREASQGRRTKSSRKGTYYTPHRLVEFILDEVFPWEGKQTDIRILDPACGSGIFLVEAYRRLISRWQQANPKRKLDAGVLRELLTNSLFGVDRNPEAVRVAAFSLYLTMCDYLDPRYVWAHVKFPPLRKTNLWDRDFFDFAESPPKEEHKFDLVIGNPPWESNLPPEAQSFLRRRDLPVGDEQVAQAFLWAAPEVCKESGRVCLIAPSKGLLFNASSPNKAFRKHFFQRHKVDIIVNFSAMRRTLFANAVGPAAPVVYGPRAPEEGHEIIYCCPKPWHSPEDGWHYVIESRDISRIPTRMAIEHDFIWKTAMWGGPRDWELISSLDALPSLEDVADRRGWVHAEGFKVGSSDRSRAPWLTGKPYLAPDQVEPFTVEEGSLSPLKETLFHRAVKTKKQVFRGPHVLIRQSPVEGKHFAAALLKNDAVFNHSVLGISGPPDDVGRLGAVCVACATNICAYFAMMTSSRWLVERDELEKGEIMQFPVPRDLHDGVMEVSYSELAGATRDDAARKKLVRRFAKAYGLSDAELMLIHDAVTHTLDYFRFGDGSTAAKPADDEMLRSYARTLCRSLKESFGTDTKRGFPATFYTGDNPMIVLAVTLSEATGTHTMAIRRTSDELSSALNRMDTLLLEKTSSGVFVRRDVHVYDKDTVYIAKRNQRRLWTQSSAMREADEIYAEIMTTWGRSG